MMRKMSPEPARKRKPRPPRTIQVTAETESLCEPDEYDEAGWPVPKAEKVGKEYGDIEIDGKE
jgi:hypothetical protein